MLTNWINSSDSYNNFILSSRIRLARNLKGINFPHKLDDDNAIAVTNNVDLRYKTQRKV